MSYKCRIKKGVNKWTIYSVRDIGINLQSNMDMN